MIGIHNILNAAAVSLAFTIGLPKISKVDYTILKEFKEDLLIYLIIII